MSNKHHGPGPRGAMEKPKNFKGAFHKLAMYLSPFKWSILIAVIFSAFSTVFTIIGPKKLGEATTLLANGFVLKVKNEGSIDFDGIKVILLTLVVYYLISALCNYIQSYLMSSMTQKISYNLRKAISEKMNRLPLSFYDSHSNGDLLSRISNDVDTVAQSLNQSLSQIITSLATLIGVLIMMISISGWLTLIALCIVPLTGVLAMLVISKSQKYFRAQQAELGNLNGYVEEIYGGHSVVKAFGNEEKTITHFSELNSKLYNSAWKSQFLSGLMMPLSTFVGNLGYVAVCFAGGFLAIKGRLSIGDIQAFIQYVRSFNQPITQAAQIMNTLQSTMAASERVFEFLDEQEECAEVSNPVSVDSVQGDIVFDHVSFGYDPSKIIIHDFSINIHAGQKIAIVGPTGAGKTTIVKLLMRFYELNSGSILLDGTDITQFTRSDLRNQFGMVLQDSWLFNGTIMENLRYGKLDATDEEVIHAADLAYVDHFIRTLDHGYQTEINEESTNISQGQKQLLTIARAFLKDPKILILDEATSSVDTRTEILIQKGMENLMKGRTSFIIAHRLSTIRDADLILVMKDGDIVESGNHQELLARNGFYAQLYNSQFESAN